jgi:hypothetical protein
MALVLLSALVAGALYVSTEELRAGRGDLANERALAAAESALERAVVSWDAQQNTSLTVGMSVNVERWSSGSGDRADVTATRVGLRTVWLTAAATSGADGRTIPARHTIAAALRLVGPRFPLTASLTAAGKVTIRDGTVDGRDASTGGVPPTACADDANADVAGVLVRDALLACGATCSGGAPAGVTGSPPVAVDVGLTSAVAPPFGDDTRATLARGADLVLAAGTFAPRPTVAGDRCKVEDPFNWGDPGGGVCGDLFRIVHIRGDAVLGAGSVAQGVLVLDGTLRVEPGASFSGVVIAANDIEVVGAGASITGVTFSADADGAGESLVADGGEVRFSSCAVRRTALGVARLTRTPGRWWAELR